MALISPAISHPGVIVYAIAARDRARAIAFAHQHNIPVVKDSYEAILEDPQIDVVYIPLPAGLHFEWASKALTKGKHVLLEKPATPTSQDARVLFHHPRLSHPTEPRILMEAFHSRFTPAWKLFQSYLDGPNVTHAHATAYVPSFVVKETDIRFKYDLGGGALLDLGTYPLAALRAAFGSEPIECIDARLTGMAPPRERCDHTFSAKLLFPNGGIGEIDGTMRATNMRLYLPTITVSHRPVAAPEVGERGPGTKTTRTRKVVFYNYMFATMYHRIDVVDEFTVTNEQSGTIIQRFTKTEHKKAYTFREMGLEQPGEIYWSTYRYMLEQFVTSIRKKEDVFVSPQDSILQAQALDMVYEKSELGARPKSEYQPEFV
ncbi:hypothetical protein N0V82_005109 [Gnomoniopsis sp. IMI 355080]|nr:hypothetical protein N0V82_005109 [Gnomoniopsis sp. IMI 355080]